MTLDLLLFFISLGLMAAVVILRRPVVLLSLVTVAQWYLGAELQSVYEVAGSSTLISALISFGFHLSLPAVGLLLFKRQYQRTTALGFLLIVVWAITYSALSLELLQPAIQLSNGFFYGLILDNQLQILGALVVLSFMASNGVRAPKRNKK
jgi:hypothetical protein